MFQLFVPLWKWNRHRRGTHWRGRKEAHPGKLSFCHWHEQKILRIEDWGTGEKVEEWRRTDSLVGDGKAVPVLRQNTQWWVVISSSASSAVISSTAALSETTSGEPVCVLSLAFTHHLNISSSHHYCALKLAVQEDRSMSENVKL